jgi:hypothetical protein
VTLPRTRQALQIRSAETSPPGGCLTNDPSRPRPGTTRNGSLQHLVTKRGRHASGQRAPDPPLCADQCVAGQASARTQMEHSVLQHRAGEIMPDRTRRGNRLPHPSWPVLIQRRLIALLRSRDGHRKRVPATSTTAAKIRYDIGGGSHLHVNEMNSAGEPGASRNSSRRFARSDGPVLWCGARLATARFRGPRVESCWWTASMTWVACRASDRWLIRRLSRPFLTGGRR